MARIYFVIGFLSAMLFMLIVSSTYNPYRVEVVEKYKNFKNNEWFKTMDEERKLKVLSLLNLETRSRLVTNSIIKHSLELNIPMTLAFSLAKNESNFRIKLKNRNNNRSYDYGLFQLNSSYRKDWTPKDYFDIDKNVKEGLEYLKEMIDKTETLELALASYNAGPTRVRRMSIPYSTFNYVAKIKNWEEYLKQKLRLIH